MATPARQGLSQGLRIGVLALQGAFREHRQVLDALGCETWEVRKPEELLGVQGLVIPGGESTTMGKLMTDFDLLEPLRRLGRQGVPIYGTCAGLVVLAAHIIGSDQPRLGLMDIWVRRNAFGRQVESFEADLAIPALGEDPFPAVFIRAPWVEKVGPNVEVLASIRGQAVLVRQDHLLASSFHPELTADPRLHQYFLEMVEEAAHRPAAGELGTDLRLSRRL